MTDATARFFDNYTKIPTQIPVRLWWVARIFALVFTVAVVAALLIVPDVAIRFFWGLLIPVVPILLVFAPGLWRQVCPMAFMNQLPRMFGFGLDRTLPEFLRDKAFMIACGSLIAVVLCRWPLLNHAPYLVAGGAVLSLALAFVGGLVFKGRSGWCGTFCAIGPIQRVYGQAPVVVVRNGFCSTCVGCQKNCYDFNPRAAVFGDVYDEDPRYAGQRRVFMGMLPGLLLGYFAQGAGPAYGEGTRAAIMLASTCASAGLYGLATVTLPFSVYRISAVFSAAAVAIYYWWSGPNAVSTAAWMFGTTPPDWLLEGSQSIGIIGALSILGMGYISERRFVQTRAAARSAESAGAEHLRSKAGSGAREVTDRSSGVAFEAKPDATLLDALQAAGLKINYGCRSGVCGADAVAICEGAENLTPIGDDELATLRRLGLEGKARLACVCKVSGPVVIDRDPHSGPAAAPAAKRAPPADRAKGLGIGRVVIVGNGVAGMGVAEALRRDSPSVEITLVTNESAHFYNRMAIGRIVYDGLGTDGLQLVPDAWFNSNNVTVLRNTVAASIDRNAKTLRLATGQDLPYDRLVLANGARASTPTPDFLHNANAFVLRSADDARALRSYAQMTSARRAVVIGGGVLGVEAADALHHLGLHVAILQRADRLMNAQLDVEGAGKLQTYFESLGVQSVCDATVSSFEGAGVIQAARLAHGPRVRADIFVACLGIQPNVFLAEQAGLEVGRGIKVDAGMRTTDSNIYAVGDVAEVRSGPGGLWPVAAAQAAVAVASMIGEEKTQEAARVTLRLKCDGVDLYSFGRVEGKPGEQQFTAAPNSDAWWRVVTSGEDLIGAVYVGPPGSGRKFSQMLQSPDEAKATVAALQRGEVTFLRSD